MAIREREQKKLLLRSGGRCAFQDCRRVLTFGSDATGGVAILGEMAHIVAERPDGPRGNSPLPIGERNKYENLILLCNVHHQLIDDKPQTYTVERLHQIKKDHEEWVEKTLGRSASNGVVEEPPQQPTETVYSTLLPVERMPNFVFGAPCELRDEKDVKKSLRDIPVGELAPFILRDSKLFAFHDLCDPDNPFRDVINVKTAQRYVARSWWDDPNYYKWFIELLNRVLNKITGRRGLNFDKKHHRYFFQPEKAGQVREVSYRPLNKDKETRKVVWQPISKTTGEGRGYWYHRAVALRFFRISSTDWCLSIRPELHVTKDGIEPLASEKIGARVTRKKSRMFNYDLLGEVQFWRDYLSEQKPRIIGRFGKQSLIVPTKLAEGKITWPGIPKEYSMPFTNIEYLDDLFTWAEYSELDAEMYDNGFEDWHVIESAEEEVDESDDLFGE
jgi:hypothetical protein